MKKAITQSFFVILVIFSTSLTMNAQSQLMVSLGLDQTLCFGAYTELTAFVAGGTAPYTYKWMPTEELSSSNSEMVIATPTYTTTYKVIVTDAKGVQARDEVKLEVNQRPTVVMTPPFNSIEIGQSTTLSARVTGGTGNYTYTWKPAIGLSDPTSPNPVAKPSMTTAYTLMVKDSKGCTVTEQVSVSVEGGAAAARFRD
jgi:hypothetical protein